MRKKVHRKKVTSHQQNVFPHPPRLFKKDVVITLLLATAAGVGAFFVGGVLQIQLQNIHNTKTFCPISGSNPDYYCARQRESGYYDIEDIKYKCDGRRQFRCLKENPSRNRNDDNSM